MRRTWALLVVGAMASACMGAPGTTSPEGTSYTPSPLSSDVSRGQARAGQPRVVATDLEVPWGLVFLPGGDALVTERDSGRLLRVTPGADARAVTRFGGIDPAGEGGLLGLALSPEFPRDRWVYVYYSTADDNRIARFRYPPNGAVGERQVLVEGIPHGTNHNGGRLLFGPDGMLYASTGESGRPSLAQDRDSLGGKILRMAPDGEPAPDNPFGTLVWSYGHRNVEGLAFDRDGRLYASEFGDVSFDELNLIRPGRNYGWPEVEGFAQGSPHTNPLLTWATAEASPAGVAIAGGGIWVAALRGERLWRVPLADGGGVGEPEPLYVEEYGRLRTVALAPSGELWLMTSNLDGRGDPREGDKILAVPLGS